MEILIYVITKNKCIVGLLLLQNLLFTKVTEVVLSIFSRSVLATNVENKGESAITTIPPKNRRKPINTIL
jgi:Mg/Co/Ni transporter MgtE